MEAPLESSSQSGHDRTRTTHDGRVIEMPAQSGDKACGQEVHSASDAVARGARSLSFLLSKKSNSCCVKRYGNQSKDLFQQKRATASRKHFDVASLVAVLLLWLAHCGRR